MNGVGNVHRSFDMKRAFEAGSGIRVLDHIPLYMQLQLQSLVNRSVAVDKVDWKRARCDLRGDTVRVKSFMAGLTSRIVNDEFKGANAWDKFEDRIHDGVLSTWPQSVQGVVDAGSADR